jgi:hypothetical protein
MVSYTGNKNLATPTVSGDSGAWGTELNNSTISPLDLMLGGVDSISLSSTTYTLSSTEIQNLGVKCTGTLLANVTVYSSCVGFYFVENNTTGNFTVTWQANFGAGGVGTGWAIPQGSRTWFASDTTAGARPCPTWLSTLLTSSLVAAQSGNPPITGRRTETANGVAYKVLSLQSGDGYGNDYSIYETGDGSSNVTTVTEQIGSTVVDTKTAASRTFGVPVNPITLAEASTPSVPSSGTIQLYGYSGDFLASYTHGGVQYLYGKDPTVQQITASGTYTPTPGMVRIRVRMVGGGGAGNGGTGGTTHFGTWTAIGGACPAGGTGGTDGTGTRVNRTAGNAGGGAAEGGGAFSSANGGAGPWGGGGAPGGSAAAANSGAGGGTAFSSGHNPTGGGSGEYIEFYMTAAQVGSSLSVTIGAAGTGGDYNGGSGLVIVEEFYN